MSAREVGYFVGRWQSGARWLAVCAAAIAAALAMTTSSALTLIPASISLTALLYWRSPSWSRRIEVQDDSIELWSKFGLQISLAPPDVQAIVEDDKACHIVARDQIKSIHLLKPSARGSYYVRNIDGVCRALETWWQEHKQIDEPYTH